MRARTSVISIGLLLIGLLVVPGSAAAVPGIDGEIDCADETEVEVAITGEGEVQTENVSSAWQQHVDHVEAVRADFENEYPLDEHEWIHTIGITSIDESVCESTQMAISLGVADEELAQEEIGETYEDVPVVIREQGEPVPAVANAGDGEAMQADDETEETPDDDMMDALPTPGFGVIPPVVGVLVAAIIARYRDVL